MGTTFATHNLQRRSRSQHATFVALLALAIAVGVYGVVNNTSTAVDPVGVGSASALPSGIDPAFVNALASHYPPVEQAADYTAAAGVGASEIDPALVSALASHYPPVEQAADYTRAANAVGSGIDPALVNALASHYPPAEQAADDREAAG